MTWLKIGRRCGFGVAWLCAACGEAPPPPTALMDPATGAEAAGGTSTVILGAQPPGSEDVPDAGAPPAADAAPPPLTAEPPEAAGPDDGAPPAGGAPVFSGCTATTVDCDEIFITVLDGELCVQLSLDNCNTYARPGLPADVVPLAWRLGSAVVVPRAQECEPLESYPGTVPVADASGVIDWDDEALVPSDVQIDVALRPSQAIEGSELVPESVAVATTLAGPLPDCLD